MGKKKTAIIAQEIKFARSLAHNDKKTRDKMLKQLRSWMSIRSRSSFAFTEQDFMRLWKGLFYCMWMSDKPLIQEELAESISKLVHCLEKLEPVLLYTKCALNTLSYEWFGIDHYRMDKFEMLARRIFRQTLVLCKKKNWDAKFVKGVGKIVETLMEDPKGASGFKSHIIEIYMEEIAKVSDGKIPEEMLLELIRPFAIHIAASPDVVRLRHILKSIFRYLIFQSDVGMEYQEQFNAWKKAGFPTGSIDAMEKVELSDEENEEDDNGEEVEEKNVENKPLDPRAGRVDVEIPQLPFNPAKVASLLKEYKFLPSSTPETRRKVEKLIKDFSTLAEGQMPIGIKKVVVPQDFSEELDPDLAAFRLQEFQEELFEDTKKSQKRKKQLEKVNNDVKNNQDEESLPSKKKIKKTKKKTYEESENKSSDQSNEVKETKAPKSSDKLKKVNKLSKVNKVNKVVKVKKVKKMKKILTKAAEDLKSKKQLATDDFKVADASTLKSSKDLKKKKKKLKAGEGETPRKRITPIPVESNPWLVSAIKKAEMVPKTQTSPKKSKVLSNNEDSPKKRVKIVLKNNTAQNTSEYFRQLRSSPSIPFDANRKPSFGVLKSSPFNSPINPFYKKV